MSSREELVARYISRVATKGNIGALLRAQVGGNEGAVPPQSMEIHREANEAIREILNGRTPSPAQVATVEAIILPKIRPVLDIVDGDFHTDHPLWQKLNDDVEIRSRLQRVIHSIGRLDLPENNDYPYGGTAFVVGIGIIMTNRHVAEIFASGLGTQKLDFRPGFRASIDFRHELDRPTGPTFRVKQIVLIHPYWDMALLAVDGLPESIKPLSLSLRDFPREPMTEVAAIGYPAFDYRNDAREQNDLFRNEFGVKRLLPGTLGGRKDTESFGKTVPALRHNCSTLGGNSGSALIDFKEGEVIALHFGGRFHEINYAVPACELARDARVVDTGVNFAGPAPRGEPPWNQWWVDADESIREIGVDQMKRSDDSGTRSTVPTASLGDSLTAATSDEGVQIVVPLCITIRIGSDDRQIADISAADKASETETLAGPWHDDSYASRTGYDETFLDTMIRIPMPEPEDPSALAKTRDGGTELKYQNFSIKMHAKRRLALFTASNVTAEAKLKRPEPGRDYTRMGLSGLGKSDQELWFSDPRLDEQFQLSDFFYTRDNGAFDKGHIVRRDDVAWGKTYSLLRRANGDTYHVTNCSPQVAGFNRSSLGEDNWGDLENHVLKSAASERYCQFAGPILDPKDEVFVGKIGKGAILRVKIPARFWKVIVSKTTNGHSSYAFLLEQDLADVPFEEFVVPKNFRRLMVPLEDLQNLAGIKFDPIVLNADQYGTDEGLELAFRAGLKRRSQARDETTAGEIH